MNNTKKNILLLMHFINRDLRERYAASSLGVLWSFVYPILFILIYWFVFSKIMRAKGISNDVDFLPFLLSGLFPWFAIQEGIIRGANSVVEKGYIIKKMPIPKELLPISSCISSFFHHSIGFIIFITVYFITYGLPSFKNLVFLATLAILQLIFSVGWSLIFSSLVVYFRDIVQVISISLQGMFFLIPIFYPISAIPEEMQIVAQINPVTHLLEGYRSLILHNTNPDMWALSYFLTSTAIITLLGFFIFNRLKHGFADTL